MCLLGDTTGFIYPFVNGIFRPASDGTRRMQGHCGGSAQLCRLALDAIKKGTVEEFPYRLIQAMATHGQPWATVQ
jgi:hypothetical protein